MKQQIPLPDTSVDEAGNHPLRYLDNAATSYPKPPEVLFAIQDAMRFAGGNPGRSGHELSLRAGRIALECREAVADYLRIPDPMQLVFCFNCTDALNTAIRGCLNRGDHVITTALEHNSVLRPLMGLKRAGLIDVTILAPDADGDITPGLIERVMTPKTRLVATTHASNVLGCALDVEDIAALCRRRGVLHLVDGAQAAGCLPVSVERIGCDFYAFPGHKGLLGPQGTGGLYVRHGVRLRPLREGGTGSSSHSVYQPDEMPERFESGTINLPGIAGLLAGVRHLSEHDRHRHARERELTEAIERGLAEIPGVTLYPPRTRERAPVISFNIDGYQSGQVADALSGMGICVRGGLHCAPLAHQYLGTLARGAVRVSPGGDNDAGDAEALLAAVRALASQNGD